MEIQFDLKEYLEKEFKNISSEIKSEIHGIKGEIQEIKTELKEHRRIEAEIQNDVNVLKSKYNWLLCILSPIGTVLSVGIVKIVFFS